MKKSTTKEFIERSAKKHNGFYDYSKSVYTTARKKLIIICPKHGEFKQKAQNHLLGRGCPECRNILLSKLFLKTTSEFVKRATKKHNGVYDYSKSVYITSQKKLIIICPKHGEFKQKAQSHLSGQGCSECSCKRKKTTEEFIEESTKKHNGLYDYSKSVYITSQKKLIIICPEHGEFKQEAKSHLNGNGCAKCFGNSKSTTGEFIEKATKKHNGFYDYSKSVYIGTGNRLIIICPKHGEFEQNAKSHLNGRGCSKCSRNRKNTTEEFIEMSAKKHNGFYDYSKSVYVNAHNELIIICPKHGEFKQKPDNHLRGKGCLNVLISFQRRKLCGWIPYLSQLRIGKKQ